MSSTLWLGLALIAGDPSGAQQAGAEHRPRYEAAPEVRRRFEALEKDSKQVAWRADDRVVDSATTRIVTGLLVKVDDGHVLLRVPVSKAQAVALEAQGARRVPSARDTRSNVLFAGHYYRLFRAAPEVDLAAIADRSGHPVRLVVAKDVQGVLRVTGASVAP